MIGKKRCRKRGIQRIGSKTRNHLPMPITELEVVNSLAAGKFLREPDQLVFGFRIGSADAPVHGKRGGDKTTAYDPVRDRKHGQDARDFSITLGIGIAGLEIKSLLNGPLPSESMKQRSAWLPKNKLIPSLRHGIREMVGTNTCGARGWFKRATGGFQDCVHFHRGLVESQNSCCLRSENRLRTSRKATTHPHQDI